MIFANNINYDNTNANHLSTLSGENSDTLYMEELWGQAKSAPIDELYRHPIVWENKGVESGTQGSDWGHSKSLSSKIAVGVVLGTIR